MICKETIDTPYKAYKGQTGRTRYHKPQEHFKNWEEKAEDTVLHKHSLQCHNGDDFEVNVRILASWYRKPTTRLITEAIYIEEMSEETSMSQKSKWNYIRLPHVSIV